MKRRTIILGILFTLVAALAIWTKTPKSPDPATIVDTLSLGGTTWRSEGETTVPILSEVGWAIETLSFSPDGDILTLSSREMREKTYLIENGMLFCEGKACGLRLRWDGSPGRVLALTSVANRRSVYFESQ